MSWALLLPMYLCLTAGENLITDASNGAILVEIRQLHTNVQENTVATQQGRDAVVKLTAEWEATKGQIEEDHVAINARPGGLIVEQERLKEAHIRYSRLLWGLAGLCVTVVGGVSTAAAIKRLGLGKNGKRK